MLSVSLRNMCIKTPIYKLEISLIPTVNQENLFRHLFPMFFNYLHILNMTDKKNDLDQYESRFTQKSESCSHFKD